MHKALGIAFDSNGEGIVEFYEWDLREARKLLKELGLKVSKPRRFNHSRAMLLHVVPDRDVPLDIVAQVEATFRSRGYFVGPR